MHGKHRSRRYRHSLSLWRGWGSVSCPDPQPCVVRLAANQRSVICRPLRRPCGRPNASITRPRCRSCGGPPQTALADGSRAEPCAGSSAAAAALAAALQAVCSPPLPRRRWRAGLRQRLQPWRSPQPRPAPATARSHSPAESPAAIRSRR